MTHRIEIMFVGDAPADELERARILAGSEVGLAIINLSQMLKASGFEHTVTARTVRPPNKRPRPTLAAAAE
jgi:hypothetical protein